MGSGVYGWPRARVSLAGSWLGRVSLGGTLYKVGCSLYLKPQPLIVVLSRSHLFFYCSPQPSGRSDHTGLFAVLQLCRLMPVSRSLSFLLPLPGIPSLLCTLSLTRRSQLDRDHPAPRHSLSHCCSLPALHSVLIYQSAVDLPPARRWAPHRQEFSHVLSLNSPRVGGD